MFLPDSDRAILTSLTFIKIIYLLSIFFSGRTIKTGGTGFGTLGIPGDFTPPGRFIRAAFMKEFAEEVQTADDGVNLAFHILNTVDIPIGKYQGNKNSRNHSSND